MPRRCSRRRSQVLGLYPCRLCPAGESPSLLRLWNALLALAGFLGHGGRLALGGRSPRRNPALLAGAAAARRPPHGRPRNHEILLCRACWPASTSRSIVGRIARSG